jgi:DNA-binding response OmpR family regulator
MLKLLSVPKLRPGAASTMVERLRYQDRSRSDTGERKRFRIGILEEDGIDQDGIASLLEENNYEVTKYSNEAELRSSEKFSKLDLLLINWTRKGTLGNDLLEYMRNGKYSKCAILVLTDRIREFDIVQALNCGADDVLQKPWGVFELVARMNAILRRTCRYVGNKYTSQNQSQQQGELNNLFLNDTTIKLSNNQKQLFKVLHANLGQTVTREYIEEHVWKRDYVDDRTITVAISRVRKKLEIIAPEYSLLTVYGLGYRMECSNLD